MIGLRANRLAVLVVMGLASVFVAMGSPADEPVSDPRASDAAALAASPARAPSLPAGPPAAPSAPPNGRIGFFGHNIFGTAAGEFHAWRVIDHSIDLAEPAASYAVVDVNLASVDTKSEGRDEHLRSADFFDVAKFPVATVRGHSPRALEPSKQGRPRYAVQFDVDLHGVKKTLAGELEVVETEPVVVEGGFLIRRTDFGIGEEPSRWNPVDIDDEVPVRFKIEFP